MSRDQIYEEFSQICTEHISDMTYEVPSKRPVIMKVHEKYGDRIKNKLTYTWQLFIVRTCFACFRNDCKIFKS